uniref:butyrophilin subfamily 3 member A2-like isoform X1 n=1 Tax=Scatophagus argus TaxID=75038 RepID=UPI001ED7E7D7|nr:butyrophilin subfamily 3 member A2-like isoform X1 [Scatophagus argus]XP_046237031.1 butyrophilin subfamily 3 member A2-like isoform X1 [Scatophagus argus]
MLGAAVLVSLRTFRMLLLLCTNSLMLKSSGEELISSLQPITALRGDDVILPCGLKNRTDVSSKTVVWTKPSLDPVFIRVYQNGRLIHQAQHPSYRYRTTLFEDQLVNGNVSLKLSRVKISDAGTYVCSIQLMEMKASVLLIVGAASSPVIDLANFDGDDGRWVLRCQSSGWRPQPELSWLDSEGHVLPAGPTQTLRGPGDLYSVNSTLTVGKKNGNRFTCRVQQKNINQMRETHVQLPAHPNTSSDYTWLWALFGVTAVLILLIICVAIMKRIKYCIRRYQRPEAWTRDQDQYRVKLVAKETAETITAQGNTKENEGEDHHMLNGEKVHIPLKASNMDEEMSVSLSVSESDEHVTDMQTIRV